MFHVTLELSGGRTVTIARYANVDHARRDLPLLRVSYPRARFVSLWTNDGVMLARLRKREVR